MEWSGVALLLLVAVGVIGTGLPAAVVLIMAASAGALLGVVSNISGKPTLGAARAAHQSSRE